MDSKNNCDDMEMVNESYDPLTDSDCSSYEYVDSEDCSSSDSEDEDDVVQGSMGIVTIVERNGIRCVEKKSRNIDFTVELEIDILTKLKSLNSSQFPTLVDYTDALSPSMFVEFIDGPTLTNRYKHATKRHSSMIGMTLAAVAIMNEELGITHYDLHTGNIILRETKYDFNSYTFPDGEVLSFKTYGYEPVIIDYGQAYDGTTRMMFGQEEVGIFASANDPLAESRRLRRVPNFGTSFEPVVETIFDNLTDSDNDIWDTNRAWNVIDMLTSHLTTPLETTVDDPQDKSLEDFIKSWHELVKDLDSKNDKLRVLKMLILYDADKIHSIRPCYDIGDITKLKDLLVLAMRKLSYDVNTIMTGNVELMNQLYANSHDVKTNRQVAAMHCTRRPKSKHTCKSYDVATRTTEYY